MIKCPTVKFMIFALGLLMEAVPTSYSQNVPPDSSLQFFDFLNLSSKPTENLNVSLLLVNSSSSYIESISLPLQNETLQPNSQIDFQKEFVFIIHGYMSSGRVHWMTDLASAYVQKKDVNAFVVDWGSGSITMNYATAVQNTQTVAALLSDFINYLITLEGVNATSIHIIGHSMGAHIAGYVGKTIPNVGRITGLDPAKPLFGKPEQRLNQSDAVNVDVIHTNGFFLGCGISESIGDVDFFLNGGRLQPGCPFYIMNSSYYFNPFSIGNLRIDVFFAEFLIKLGCSHLRSIEYFIESVKNPECLFVGYREGDKIRTTNFTVDDDVSVLGLSTFEYSGRGDFYIETNSEPPYCIKN